MNGRLATWAVLGLVLLFLIGPFFIIIAASLSAGNSLAFPPQGLSLKWVVKVFEIESFRASFGMSMFLAIFGTLAALALGVPAAYGLNRYKVPGAEFVRTVVSAPIIVPGIIVGLALLRYLVIPMRPAGTEGWGEAELARLVTRDSMIGTALALDPAALQASGQEQA